MQPLETVVNKEISNAEKHLHRKLKLGHLVYDKGGKNI